MILDIRCAPEVELFTGQEGAVEDDTLDVGVYRGGIDRCVWLDGVGESGIYPVITAVVGVVEVEVKRRVGCQPFYPCWRLCAVGDGVVASGKYRLAGPDGLDETGEKEREGVKK